MKQSTGLVIALVLLGGASIMVTRLALKNYQLEVEVATLRSRQANPAKAPAPAAPAAAAAPVAIPDRVVDESARQAMVDVLSAETGSEKKMWIRVEPRDREAAAFAGQIAAVFREQGWDTKVLDTEGLRFKPGLLFLVGQEDEPPSYVTAAQKAVEAIGQPVVAGSGYLTYYADKKKESPNWQGTRFLPDQTFVLQVGRKPEAAPAAQ